MQAEEEEVHLVREFRERLRYNLQQVSFGASVVLDGVIQHVIRLGICYIMIVIQHVYLEL